MGELYEGLRGRLQPVFHIQAINEHWEDIRVHLEAVADNKCTVKDMYESVSNGRWLLWVSEIDDSKPPFMVITQFVEYPSSTSLRIVFLAGGDEDWGTGIKILEDFAKTNKCREIEIIGRRGWERVLKPSGYGLQNIILSKEIK